MICCVGALAVMGLLTKLARTPAGWVFGASRGRPAVSPPPPGRHVAELPTDVHASA